MKQILRPLDNFLNSITMYRLLLYGLLMLAAIAVFLGFSGILTLPGPALLESLAILVAVCYGANWVLSRLYQTTANSESSLITGLILFFILPPPQNLLQVAIIATTGLIAMAAKYVLAYRHKHIFNPAAVAAVIIGLVGLMHATWWIGNSAMWPFTLLLGLLVVRKIRRFALLLSFTAAALITSVVVGIGHQPVDQILTLAFTSGPLVFLGTIMLTEPATMPPTRNRRIIYGIIVGLIFASQLKFGPVYATPEIALVLGNIYAFAVSSRRRLRLRLKAKVAMAPSVYDYSFTTDQPLKFIAGQYLEWTLPLGRSDSRGNRRTFTIASAPTEPEIHLGVKFYEPSSKFKAHLKNMQVGDTIEAGQLAGDFTLPRDANQKLVFVAGGIGITPFRSIIKDLIDSGQQRDAVLFYAVADPQELVYREVLSQAKAVGVKVIPILTRGTAPANWPGKTGFLTPGMVKAAAPDFAERRYYLSGPNAMVMGYKQMLLKMGVKRGQIVADYFPGY